VQDDIEVQPQATTLDIYIERQLKGATAYRSLQCGLKKWNNAVAVLKEHSPPMQ